jgi:tetrahydromethanopterin S-methyltransferase subunit B
VIVLSVNPCSGSYARLNSGIEEFNNIVRDGLDSRITFLDSYSFLNWNSFATVDGLHYTSGTYIDIYNFVNDSINEE